MKNVRKSKAYRVFKLVKENNFQFYDEFFDFLDDNSKTDLLTWVMSEKGLYFCEVLLMQPYSLEELDAQYDELPDFHDEYGASKYLFAPEKEFLEEEKKRFLDKADQICKLIKESDFQLYIDLIDFLDKNKKDELLYFAFNHIGFCVTLCHDCVRRHIRKKWENYHCFSKTDFQRE